MNPRPHRDLELEKYRALLHPEDRAQAEFALCDETGTPVWCSDGKDQSAIGTAIEDLIDAGFSWESGPGGERRRNVGSDRVLLYRELRVETQHFGWFALMVPSAFVESQPRARRLTSTIENMVNFVSDEYRILVVNASLAGEVAKRQEELNLVYTLGDTTDVPFGAESALLPLLQNIVRHVNVDLVAFIRSGSTPPVYATSDDPIPNLDLVLVELRGDLLRFVRADQQTVVFNQRQDPRREFLLTNQPYKFLACPITRKNFDGMLVLARHDRRPDFENCDRNLAQVIGEQIGTTMRNQSMLLSMQKFGEQLAGALIEAVEAKDPYTRGHSERVQTIAVNLGHALGLERGDLRDLYWGSIMHDVGKIGIPDVILSKPGRLTRDEYTVIKTHPERSFEILKHVEHVNARTLEGARFHHERYDGGGYPQGLRGKEIPLHARIIAVADTYDAMTSSRSYRAALDHESAMAEVERVKGTQFDPEIADAFTKATEDGRNWLEQVNVGDVLDNG